MITSLLRSGYLQTGVGISDLVEWFVASVALVVVVTLLYVYVLGRSPPPEGLTEAKLEMQEQQIVAIDVSPIISEANLALSKGDLRQAVELSVRAVSLTLSQILRAKGADPANMNVSDMAYIIQSRSPGSPDITQPAYQLNLLHLKIERGESVTPQEAEWSLNTASWFARLESNA